MARIIRQGTFETNSSSAHSLTFKKGDKYEEFKHDGVFQFKLEDLEKFQGELSPAETFTSFQDRIRYVLGSIFYFFSSGEPRWIEISEECYYKIQKLNLEIEQNQEDDTDITVTFDLREFQGKYYHLVTSQRLTYHGRLLVEGLEKFLKPVLKGLTGLSFITLLLSWRLMLVKGRRFLLKSYLMKKLLLMQVNGSVIFHQNSTVTVVN